MNARFFITHFILIGAFIVAALVWRAPAAASPSVVFTKDIAPMMYANCAACHHAGGSAPFSLMTYAEVKKRAAQIVEVTKKPLYAALVAPKRDTESLSARAV